MLPSKVSEPKKVKYLFLVSSLGFSGKNLRAQKTNNFWGGKSEADESKSKVTLKRKPGELVMSGGMCGRFTERERKGKLRAKRSSQ